MRSSLRNVLGLGIAVCLGFTWACVKVEVSVLSQDSSGIPNDHTSPNWISLDDLKKLHSKHSCNPSSLIVSKEQQQTPAWCWAASARMVMEHHNNNKGEKPPKPTALQCDIVRNAFSLWIGGANCCEKQISHDFIDAPSTCVQGNWPYRVFNQYQFTYRSVPDALDWDAVTGEICSAGPFISVIEWSGGGKHAFVVKGYDHPSQSIEVYDPILNDPQDMTFDEFVGDSPRKQYDFHSFSHDRNIVQILPKDRP